jgi:M6 family metalloprotease-like protein
MWTHNAAAPCGAVLMAAGLLAGLPGTVVAEPYGAGASREVAAADVEAHVRAIDPRLVQRVMERQRQLALQAGQASEARVPRSARELGFAGELMQSSGDVKIVALLVDFPDAPHVTPAADAHAQLFGEGSPSGPDYPHESVANIYERASYGALDLHHGVALGWWTAPYDRSALGGATPAEREAAREKVVRDAIAYFDAVEGVDFTQFDNDGDGAIDYVMVVWSGAVGGDLWIPTYWAWQDLDPTFRPDGMRIAGYSWQQEGATSVAAHETGHALGLPDLYDKNATYGPGGGVGGYDMMSHRGDLNCFSKWLLDWIEPTLMPTGSQTVSLNPAGTHAEGSCLFVMPQLTPAGLFGEFFMIQYRTKTGNDNIASFPAAGLWIWHVDATLTDDGSTFRFNNSWTHHKLLRPMEADGLETIEQTEMMDAGDIYKPGDRFGDGTRPSSRRYGGETSGVLVTDILQSGGQYSARVSVLGRTAAGGRHNLLVKSDGSLWAWGGNAYGQLGVGTTSDSSVPLRVGTGLDWRFASAGLNHTVAAKTDGALWAWGWNQHGQVGDGSNSTRTSPVPVGDAASWAAVAAGSAHSAALQTDPVSLIKGLTRWAWGRNSQGQLGSGDDTGVNHPVSTYDSWCPAYPCGYDWALLSTSAEHNLAIRTDGTLWAWGLNDRGQLGDNSWSNRYLPYQITVGTDWAVVSAGGYHTLAVKKDGSLWAWGANNIGQLGDGTQYERHVPTRIGSDSDWCMVAAGDQHSLALKRDGSLWGWGSNMSGQLGVSSVLWTMSPILIGSSSDWDYVAAGRNHTLAIKTDATLWGTGDNDYGQLGDGTTTDQKVFRQILSTFPMYVELTAVPASPRQVGALVTFTAAASGGTGSYEYQFWLKAGGTWSIKQGFSTDNTWDWDTTGLAAATYPVRVYSRNAGSVAPLEASDSEDFVLLPVTPNFTLGVAKLGSGAGTVTSVPAGIDCGSDCAEDYASGTSVTLSAAASAGSVFTGWGGACSGTESCEVSMTSAQSVTATFEQKYTLSVVKSGSGVGTVTSVPVGIDCGSDCTEDYASGTSVTLTAVASACSVFTGWGGACSGTGSCIVSMTASRLVTANFEPPYTLSVSKLGGGAGTVSSVPAGIDCGMDCSEDYASGTSVTLTAVASASSVFTGWGGDCSGIGSCVVSMTAARSVTATFEPKYTLSVLKSGSGAGTVSSVPAGIDCGADCSEDYVSGTSVTLSAAASAGSVFTGWSGACSGMDSCAVSMTSAQSVTATFEQKFSLSVLKSGSGAGTVTSVPAGIDCGSDCAEDYASGTSVELTAAAAAGSVFTGWGGACSGTGSCIVSMTAARFVTATFTLLPTVDLASLTLSSADVSGCKSVTGTVTLTSPAPAAGVVVSLSDTLASASTVATVKILSGATTKNFTVKTSPVATDESGTVSATLGSTTRTQGLTLRPMGLYSVTLSPTSVAGSNPVTGTAKLECKAGPGPVTVQLGSSNPSVATPAAPSVQVPLGVQSAAFTVDTQPVLSKASAIITGTLNGASKSKTLTVTVAASVSPTSLKFYSQVINTPSPVLSATLYNKGAVPYAVLGINLTGTGATHFAKTHDCPASLPAGASCTIGVTFTPTTTGSKAAKLSIATSATSVPLGVTLSGTGVLAP